MKEEVLDLRGQLNSNCITFVLDYLEIFISYLFVSMRFLSDVDDHEKSQKENCC